MHLRSKSLPGTGPFASAVNEYITRLGKGGLEARIDAQLKPIHLAAYVLTPQFFNIPLLPTNEARLMRFITNMAGVEGYSQFTNYREKSGAFNSTQYC